MMTLAEGCAPDASVGPIRRGAVRSVRLIPRLPNGRVRATRRRSALRFLALQTRPLNTQD